MTKKTKGTKKAKSTKKTEWTGARAQEQEQARTSADVMPPLSVQADVLLDLIADTLATAPILDGVDGRGYFLAAACALAAARRLLLEDSPKAGVSLDEMATAAEAGIGQAEERLAARRNRCTQPAAEA